MPAKLPTDSEIVQTLEEVGELVSDRRWKVSPENLQSSIAWGALVLGGALLDEFSQLDAAQREWFFSVIREKFALLMTVPGAKLMYEAWRRDR